MAGFKKNLPMSRALRPGGAGTVAAPKSGPPKTFGEFPKGEKAAAPGAMAKAMPKEPKMPKLPKFK